MFIEITIPKVDPEQYDEIVEALENCSATVSYNSEKNKIWAYYCGEKEVALKLISIGININYFQAKILRNSKSSYVSVWEDDLSLKLP